MGIFLTIQRFLKNYVLCWILHWIDWQFLYNIFGPLSFLSCISMGPLSRLLLTFLSFVLWGPNAFIMVDLNLRSSLRCFLMSCEIMSTGRIFRLTDCLILNPLTSTRGPLLHLSILCIIHIVLHFLLIDI